MATKRPAPQIKTPFKDAVVWQAGKGNKNGVEITKGSGQGSENR